MASDTSVKQKYTPSLAVSRCSSRWPRPRQTPSKLARAIKPLDAERARRLANGLPVGSDLVYAGELTLGRAIEARCAL